MGIEKVGKVLLGGFGDRGAIGFLMGILDNVSPARCYEYIRDDLALLHWAKEEDLAKYKRWARRAHIDLSKMDQVTTEDVMAALLKYHPELWQLIHDCPGGLAWFNRQIEQTKQKLGLPRG